jgi:hypothetical protein
MVHCELLGWDSWLSLGSGRIEVLLLSSRVGSVNVLPLGWNCYGVVPKGRTTAVLVAFLSSGEGRVGFAQATPTRDQVLHVLLCAMCVPSVRAMRMTVCSFLRPCGQGTGKQAMALCSDHLTQSVAQSSCLTPIPLGISSLTIIISVSVLYKALPVQF